MKPRPVLLIGGLAIDASAQQPPTPGQPGSTVEPSPPAPERKPAKILGVDAALAMIIGAVLLIVIVIGIVAVSRRREAGEDTDPDRET